MAVIETHIFLPLAIRRLSVTSYLLPLTFNLAWALPEKVLKFNWVDLMAFSLSVRLVAALVLSAGLREAISCFFALQLTIASKPQMINNLFNIFLFIDLSF